jgi:UDP-N-acetylmuramoyl-L-alanyl-D-glutamate--2,6-diaminopimelate ligase
MTDKTSKLFDFHVLDKLGVPITNLVADSRQVKQGDTFMAYAGEKHDAREYIPQAIAAGANAVLWDAHDFTWNPSWKLPSLPIADLRAKAGLIASHVYGDPSQKLQLVGITGTNGKTSCSHWYAQAMTLLHRKTAVMGTMGNGFEGAFEPTINTTLDAVTMQRLFAQYVRDGAESVAMEVSSHGIAQGRISGATFSVAVLTNLSRDHLDYHQDMDTYAATKAKLFLLPGLKYAVLNLDDILGVELSRQLESKPVQVIGYGFIKQEVITHSDRFKMLAGSNLKTSISGLEFDVEYERSKEKLKTGLMGRFNAANLLAVVGALLAVGIKLSDAVCALQHVKTIPGRMEKFGGTRQPVVIVDYAHTPDALEKALSTLREILRNTDRGEDAQSNKARLICVLGCGGERDSGKRALVGEVATRFADEVIFTSDNPRGENPHAIIEDMVAGTFKSNYEVEENRALAIYQAIYSARQGDIVLIAGKGHETYQEIKGEKIPFSDAATVQQILNDLASNMQPQQAET